METPNSYTNNRLNTNFKCECPNCGNDEKYMIYISDIEYDENSSITDIMECLKCYQKFKRIFKLESIDGIIE